jgi:SAM-dependent methyltransferase
MGYTAGELGSVPSGADLGLGCGKPQAIAALKSGEKVLDLGSGGGLDCFLAAREVGETGSVIGVDMTPEMVSRARESAETGGIGNVEFRLGEIEHLPLADGVVDVVMSNCVINLSPNKPAVFREALRVLKNGGRLVVADMVATAPMTDHDRASVDDYVGCVAGAATISQLNAILTEAGFSKIRIEPTDGGSFLGPSRADGDTSAPRVVPAFIEAVKP